MPTLVIPREQSKRNAYIGELLSRLDVSQIEVPIKPPPFGSSPLSLIPRHDIVHLAHQDLARYGKSLRNPFIVTVHDTSLLVADLIGVPVKETPKLETSSILRASHIIAISQHVKQTLTDKLGIPEDKITVIYPGVNHQVFKAYKTKIMDESHIVYVGLESPIMNMYRLIEAFATVKKHFPRMKLAKIGEAGSGRYRWAVMRKLNDLGLTKFVMFIEPTSALELAHYYSSAALLIYPPLYEGFGIPPLEAMACGCPVVASNTPPIQEIISDSGLIADARDTLALANAMQEVISDTKLRHELIRRGLEQAKKFSWKDTAEQTYKVYMKVTRERDRVSARVQ